MGFFSWITCDSQESIMNAYTDECRPVYLLQPGEPSIFEAAYQGYGEFGGVDAYVWLATRNLSPDKIEGLSEEVLRQYGIMLECGNYYVDQVTGKSWACDKHVKKLDLGLSMFPNFGVLVGIEGRTPNELIQCGRWIAKPFTDLAGVIQYPLKFSFDKDAVYEDWPESKNCPRQGYFY